MAEWGERLAGVRGVLLDISGVLYDGGEDGGAAIAGSVEAVARTLGSDDTTTRIAAPAFKNNGERTWDTSQVVRKGKTNTKKGLNHLAVDEDAISLPVCVHCVVCRSTDFFPNHTCRLIIKLKRSGLKVRFCTNESQKARGALVGLLRQMGFTISKGEVTAPAPAACLVLRERGLRPHLLVHEGIRSEFDQIDMSNPNCVVIADAGEDFSYQNMNKAFQVLMELENPVLISLGKGRYYKETSGLKLDVGAYMKALEYACGIKAEVVGKPSPEFFKSALKEMGVDAHQAIMIGDDIVGDIGGAQRCGMRALQVRTGKFRPSDEHHPEVKADGYVDNLAEAVDLLLLHSDK